MDASVLPDAPSDGWGLDTFLEVAEAQLIELGLTGNPPDRRTVRYYATAGLLDRPESRGREARYRQHHLAQLLAVKTLQAAGVRLAAIAERISGAGIQELIGLIHDGRPLPDRPLTTAFWRQPPPPAPTTDTGSEPGPGTLHRQSVLTLAPGVRLVLDTELSATEAAVLSRAAEPLLNRITALGLSTDTTKE